MLTSTPVRSNQNGIMYMHNNGAYSIFNVRTQSFQYTGTLNASEPAHRKE